MSASSPARAGGRVPSTPPPSSRPPGRPHRLLSTLGLLALVVAGIELAGHALIRARVPEEDDWRAAAAHLRAHHRPTDATLAAPTWTDPLVREAAGDLVSLADAGKSDLAPFERLWVFSTRGHLPPELQGRRADEARRFGQVTLFRWDLGPSSVLYDLTGNARAAEVTVGPEGASTRCPRARGRPSGGGLGAGPMRPAEVFACDTGEPWVWVGETVSEDLELAPRHCIWQHPSRRGPVRATFRDVPLGERVVLYAGIYYEHERDLEGGPAYVDVLVDGARRGRLEHRDGRGWQRLEVPTGASPEARGEVAIEVSAPNPHFRSVCWAATTRGPAREVER